MHYTYLQNLSFSNLLNDVFLALEDQLIGIDLLDKGLYFGFDGPALSFPLEFVVLMS